jgi:hypothetical protein
MCFSFDWIEQIAIVYQVCVQSFELINTMFNPLHYIGQIAVSFARGDDFGYSELA